MTKKLLASTILATITMTTSCGQFNFFTQKSDRQLASTAVEQLTQSSDQSFNEELNDKLQSLHYYYVIGHKHMSDFDQMIHEKSLEEIYESDTYRSLIVTRELAEEIEDSIIEAQGQLSQEAMSSISTSEKKNSFLRMIKLHQTVQDFAESSDIRKSSMENLLTKLGVSVKSLPKEAPLKNHVNDFVTETLQTKQLSEKALGKDLEKKYASEFLQLKSLSDFEIQVKNVEHLGLLLDIDASDPTPKIFPSSSKAGNITGNEFPAKVWALTFDDGPGKASTLAILENLKAKGLKASFFQLAQQVKANASVSKLIKEAGMEIASHSWSHQQLTKVGPATLEKEITLATQEIEKFYDIDVQYFRLPYGAGVSTASIREKISANKLVHVFWNIDTLDWMSQTPDKIVDRTIGLMKKTSKDAGIILMHDIHARTAAASSEIMDYLKKDNRRVCTVGEIVSDINQGVAEVCSKK